MILFHGTNTDFSSIDLKKSFPFKDFGQGFYLTTIQQQAERMAQRKSLTFGGQLTVMKFDFDEAVLKTGDLNILQFESTTTEWAEFIFKNRNRALHFHHNYDIVIGPVADDGVAYLMDRYQEGSLTSKEFAQMLKYRKLNNQYCFCTQKAISYLKRI